MSNLLSYRITLAFAKPPLTGDRFCCPGHAGIERHWEIFDVTPSARLISVKAAGLPYYDNFKYKVDGQP